jgi:hypothetical protein
MTEVVHTSETWVYFNKTTLRYIPEGCHLHTWRRNILSLTEQRDTRQDNEHTFITEILYKVSDYETYSLCYVALLIERPVYLSCVIKIDINKGLLWTDTSQKIFD